MPDTLPELPLNEDDNDPPQPAPRQPREPGFLFGEAVAIMARLRGPGGCPWDHEQDFNSIRKHTLEETYEVLDAIERRHWPDLKDELGDLLLQVLFYAQMAAEPGYFTIGDVIEGLNRKLIRRHPHVFGETASREAGNASSVAIHTPAVDAQVVDPASVPVDAPVHARGGIPIDTQQVLRKWDAIKAAEKRSLAGPQGTTGNAPESRLDSISRSMPALMEAAKLGSRAAKCGFDWPDAQGIFAKIEEEISELHDAIRSRDEASSEAGSHANPKPGAAGVAEELGDLLFSVVNLARHLKVDPELALHDCNAKFRRRFRTMETESPQPLEDLTPEQLEVLWATAKRAETRPDPLSPSAPHP